MAGSASGQTLYSNAGKDPEVSIGPNPPGPDGLSTKSQSVGLRFRTKALLLISGLLVLVVALAVAYFLTNRRGGVVVGSDSSEDQVLETKSYQNPNGFKFKYPSDINIAESKEGIMLTGKTEMAFAINPMEEPLGTMVKEIAQNFGLTEDDQSSSLETLNSRTGYLLEYQGKEYHYFPLYGDYYLEIVMKELDQTGLSILSSLEFTAPEARLN